ncbi:hypothetical protein B0H14DRAFT_2673889 [Mycena olivaceomarginata]|nr:hypothetical protein B0H14DRAFT_2673889 [Mycena olivaceomarginata]
MDGTLKKRRNADAQAAFRKRRDTYIQSLEGAVTNLEPVAKNLQEVLHESRVEILALQVENARLRSQYVEQEKLWRTTWQSNAAYPGIPDLPELESSSGDRTSQMSTFIDDNMVAVPHDASIVREQVVGLGFYHRKFQEGQRQRPDDHQEGECCLREKEYLLQDRVRSSSPTPKPATKRRKATSDKEDDSLMLEKPPPP